MSGSETSHSIEGAPAVDLVALMNRCLGNFKIVERVLATFRDAGLSDLNELQSALEAANFQALTEIAHRFKGAASNVSALRLQELLMRAEQCGREQNSEELTSILDQLRLEWEAFKRFAQVFIPATGNVPRGSVRLSHSYSEAKHAGAGC